MNILIAIPTLNEAGNIGKIINSIRALPFPSKIMIIDDGSDDGTVDEISEAMVGKNDLWLIQRGRRLGIGSAHKQALTMGISSGFDVLVTLDGDGTHDPRYIESIINALKVNDIAIASRFLQASSIRDWPFFRVVLTYLSHWVTRIGLGIPYDCSSGFRAYRLKDFSTADIQIIKENGYDFFYSSAFRMHKIGKCIGEVPIVLGPRNFGSSKMSLSLAIISIMRLALEILKFRFGIYKDEKLSMQTT